MLSTNITALECNHQDVFANNDESLASAYLSTDPGSKQSISRPISNLAILTCCITQRRRADSQRALSKNSSMEFNGFIILLWNARTGHANVVSDRRLHQKLESLHICYNNWLGMLGVYV